ncbi:unnamed protein product [Polarella glacialis]|uniref:Methyltransferase domain-containing protein n=1 Tax=Polarella glacialis TaxID=89957 RepID=A0A813L802_POLGL|nr:unnamed protein product [Polarella glacialis]
MRFDMLVTLLKELHSRRGGKEPLVVVEVGVFIGKLSRFLLQRCDFIKLVGVDPYIGSDDTFPGKSDLDPNAAFAEATGVFEQHGGRASLMPMTSEAAAATLQDGSIDAIFIDGCHLYDCVRQDFELWMPKMRRDVETLVSGHDFSPMWPGVVRAVHEQRPGQSVQLSTDWMFWWFQ